MRQVTNHVIISDNILHIFIMHEYRWISDGKYVHLCVHKQVSSETWAYVRFSTSV